MSALAAEDPFSALLGLVSPSCDALKVVDLRISDATVERGLVARRPVAEGEVVLRVDREHTYSEDSCDAALAAALDTGDHVAVDGFLVKMVLALHDIRSSTGGIDAAYFQTLPTDFSHMPLHFNDAILDAFGPSFPLSKLAAAVREQCAMAHAVLCGLELPTPISLDFVHWATCCLNSRCFEFSAGEPGAPPQRCLIPFADLLNHSFSPNLRHHVDSDGAFSFTATRDIAEGDELTVEYRGDLDACSFLLHYGFYPHEAVSGGEGLRVFFRVAFDEADLGEGAPLRAAVRSLGLEPSADMALPATIEQPLPPLWIWLLRLKGMTTAQRTGFAAGRVELGAAVEAEAWATIRQTLSDHREWYLARQSDARAAEARDATGSRAVQELSAVVAKVAIEVTTAALAQLPPGP